MQFSKRPETRWGRLMAALDRILPAYARLPLLAALAWNAVAYYGTRLVVGDCPHHLIDTALDGLIPFVPWTVSIYYACYLFWVVNYILATRRGKQEAYRFLSADFLAKTVCLVCFLVFPTTNIRPVVGETGFWNGVMRSLYAVDAADNLFPSIHCLTSWFCYLGIREDEHIPRWYRTASFWMAAAVFVSTLTTKQHVIADVIGGVALATFSYYFTGHSRFAQRYGAVFDRLTGHRSI